MPAIVWHAHIDKRFQVAQEIDPEIIPLLAEVAEPGVVWLCRNYTTEIVHQSLH